MITHMSTMTITLDKDGDVSDGGQDLGPDLGPDLSASLFLALIAFATALLWTSWGCVASGDKAKPQAKDKAPSKQTPMTPRNDDPPRNDDRGTRLYSHPAGWGGAQCRVASALAAGTEPVCAQVLARFLHDLAGGGCFPPLGGEQG